MVDEKFHEEFKPVSKMMGAKMSVRLEDERAIKMARAGELPVFSISFEAETEEVPDNA